MRRIHGASASAGAQGIAHTNVFLLEFTSQVALMSMKIRMRSATLESCVAYLDESCLASTTIADYAISDEDEV